MSTCTSPGHFHHLCIVAVLDNLHGVLAVVLHLLCNEYNMSENLHTVLGVVMLAVAALLVASLHEPFLCFLCRFFVRLL